jgi:hypothetical protein
VNDPERVLDLRDLLVPLLLADALRSLDRELARWCMGLIQKRLRTETITANSIPSRPRRMSG